MKLLKEDSGKLVTGLLIATVFILMFNSYQISQLKGNQPLQLITGKVTGITDIIPKGVPKIYGQELEVSFGDVSPDDPQKADATIGKLVVFDRQIKLSGEQLQRYISIAGSISCEYCCGAQSIIFTKDQGNYKAGDAACGCAHSYAMRGLAKYLITKHGNEYTDEEILEELGKWKVLFFPDIHIQKAAVLKEKGIELNYINLASNKYRGVEKGASGSGGSMVGGC